MRFEFEVDNFKLRLALLAKAGTAGAETGTEA
jgi:hypothetical protein